MPSPITLDPHHPGTLIRRLMALEAAVNILSAIPMLLYPSSIVSHLTSSGTAPPSTTQLTQWLGALILALTPQLLLALPNTKTAIESRATVYVTLGPGEAMLISIMLWQAWAGEEGGLSARALVRAAGILVGPLVGRGWVLGWRPELLGR
ncbi:MAG: hypothetical protein FRX48_06032 [Lasallia pustulata]|uniref:Uncharacterized protein n=1 Tax=Lasallia pustulata TaxID=136370 RepID=A0A5M8PNU7_9LECA|nr:MAG: hypothetical protein FRX48_06032 [Lasallia pustulata]